MIVCRVGRRGTLKRSLLCIVGLIILGVLVLRADAGGAVGEEPTLDDRLARLVEQLEKHRKEMHVPGMAVAIVKDDEVILSRGFGLRDIEEDLYATDETVFAIGSTTKAFTAALVAMMAEEGKLDWDDPLRKHLEDFALYDEEVAAKVTIRDALSHRTGLGSTDLVWASGQATPHDILQAIATAKPRGEFRKHFGYNNPMYLFVGMATENIAGTEWTELLASRIFEPLGMTNSNASTTIAMKQPQMAKGYRWDEKAESFEHVPMRVLDNIAPAGALNSNVRDMAQWIRLMLGRGEIDGKRLISENQIEQMWTGHTAMGPGVEYGLGWGVRIWRGRRLIEHSGGIDGFMAHVALLPDEHVGFVLLTNVMPTPLIAASTELVFAGLLDELDDSGYPDAAELQEYLGQYRFDPIDDDVTVLVRDGKLAVDVPGQMVFTLLPPDEDDKWQFEITDTIKISFVKNDDGEVIAMKLHQAGMTFDLPRAGVQQEIETEVELADVAAYLGRYEWPLGPGDIEVLIHNGMLAADVPGQTVYELRPPDEAGRWVFRATSDIAIRFNRDEESNDDAAVISLTILHGGAETQHRRIAGVSELVIPDVDELVERVLAAHGVSPDRMVYPLRIRQRIHLLHQGITGEGTIESDSPETFRDHVDLKHFGFMTTVIDEEGGRVESTFGPKQDLTDTRLEQFRNQHPLSLYRDWRENFDTIRVIGLEADQTVAENENARTLVRVELTKGDFRRIVSVDLETGLIVGERYSERFPQGVTVMRTVTYDDHLPIQGLLLPHRLTMSDDLLGMTKIEVVEVRLNAR